MTTPQELYEQVTVSRNQLLKEINLQLVHKETEGTLYRTLNLSNSAHINEKRDRYRGRCYTFHPSHQLRKLGIYRMHITLYVNRFCPKLIVMEVNYSKTTSIFQGIWCSNESAPAWSISLSQQQSVLRHKCLTKNLISNQFHNPPSARENQSGWLTILYWWKIRQLLWKAGNVTNEGSIKGQMHFSMASNIIKSVSKDTLAM